MARMFVGVLLTSGAAVTLFIVFIAAMDVHRQSNVRPNTVIKMGTRL